MEIEQDVDLGWKWSRAAAATQSKRVITIRTTTVNQHSSNQPLSRSTLLLWQSLYRHHGHFVDLECQEQAQEITVEAILCKYSRHTDLEPARLCYQIDGYWLYLVCKQTCVDELVREEEKVPVSVFASRAYSGGGHGLETTGTPAGSNFGVDRPFVVNSLLACGDFVFAMVHFFFGVALCV